MSDQIDVRDRAIFWLGDAYRNMRLTPWWRIMERAYWWGQVRFWLERSQEPTP